MEEIKIPFKKFLPGIAWFFIVAILTLMPEKDVPDVGWLNIPNFDKFVHVVLFGGLTLLFCFPFLKIRFSFNKKRIIFIRISILMILWGFIIELIQKFFVTGRSFEWLDLLADSVGVLIAFWISSRLIKSHKLVKKIPFY
jgi:VanZ family protein